MKRKINFIRYSMLTLFLSNYSLAQEAWFEQSFNEYHFSSVYFIDSTIGWIVGNSDTIFKTTDGGENWNGPSYNPITHTGHSIQFVNENLGWVVGSETSVLGTIHKSTDGGSSWFAQNNPSPNNISFFIIIISSSCYFGFSDLASSFLAIGINIPKNIMLIPILINNLR